MSSLFAVFFPLSVHFFSFFLFWWKKMLKRWKLVTIKCCTKHLFAGWNTQQISSKPRLHNLWVAPYLWYLLSRDPVILWESVHEISKKNSVNVRWGSCVCGNVEFTEPRSWPETTGQFWTVWTVLNSFYKTCFVCCKNAALPVTRSKYRHNNKKCAQ